MSPAAVTYYCDDAADSIAQLIEDEQEKKSTATRTRDLHRAETSIRAYREALRVVLLAQVCADGQQHPMPDVDEYLAGRAPAA